MGKRQIYSDGLGCWYRLRQTRKSFCNTHGREPVDTLRTFYIKPFVQLLLRHVAHNIARIRSVARMRTLLKATENQFRAAQNAALGVSRGRVAVQISTVTALR